MVTIRKIDKMMKYAFIRCIISVVIFYVLWFISQKQPTLSEHLIFIIFCMWFLAALATIASIVEAVILAVIRAAVLTKRHELHYTGLFAKYLRKFYGMNISEFECVKICGLWICCDKGGSLGIEDCE